MKVEYVGLDVAGLDCTYFRTSNIIPRVDGDTLTVINGRGTRRRWGTPNVSSRVDRLCDHLIRVTVVGWHKWTIAPVGGTYYFVRDNNGVWAQRRANHSVVRAALGEQQSATIGG